MLLFVKTVSLKAVPRYVVRGMEIPLATTFKG